LLVDGLVGTQIYLLMSHFLDLDAATIIVTSVFEFLITLPTVFAFNVFPFMHLSFATIIITSVGALANTIDLWYNAKAAVQNFNDASKGDEDALKWAKYLGIMTLFLIPLEFVYFGILKNTLHRY
jgi:hypothetical protein